MTVLLAPPVNRLPCIHRTPETGPTRSSFEVLLRAAS